MQDISQYRNNFDTFYKNNLKALFDDLENKRKTYFKLFVISALMTFIVMPILMYYLFLHFGAILQQINLYSFNDVIPWVFLIGGGICALPIKLYKNQNKKIIMPEFIKFFEGFEYNKGGAISEVTLKKSKITPDYHFKEDDDYFYGTYKGVDIIVSEEKLIKQVHTKNGTRDIVKFRGIFVSLEMNKNFEGQTVVLKDKGFLNAFNGVSGLKNIKLEDPVFEKEWEVYSDCQVEARYLLTTAFMDRVLKVKELYKSKCVTFSFFDNVLFMAIDMQKDMFETSSLFKSTVNKKHITETLEQFLSILEIVDILKLNQRIGM